MITQVNLYQTFERSRKLFTLRDIEVSELEGVTFPFHKHISGDGGLGPRPAETSQTLSEEATSRQSPRVSVLDQMYSAK